MIDLADIRDPLYSGGMAKTRSKWLQDVPCLRPELVLLVGVHEPAGDGDPEPPDPPAVVQAEIAATVREILVELRRRMPETVRVHARRQ